MVVATVHAQLKLTVNYLLQNQKLKKVYRQRQKNATNTDKTGFTLAKNLIFAYFEVTQCKFTDRHH